MPKPKVTQVVVSGLSTNSNASGLPAGSCAVATNVVSRRPGLLTPCPSSTALATLDSINFTSGKGLWSDADNAVVAVLPQNVDANAWVPGTDETQIGELVAYTVNQTAGAVPQYELTQLQIGYDSDNDPIYRNVGFIPGITHTAYSHFRNVITEKWGSIATFGQGVDYIRWAGLLPPQLVRGAGIGADDNWFFDGNSVRYRAHVSLESTDQDRPYIVVGPVSNVLNVYNSGSDGAYVSLFAVMPSYEPSLVTTNEYDVYLNLYRSTQDDVETAQELPFDLQLVQKIKVTTDGLVSGAIIFPIEDRANDLARAQGVYLYTNPEQEGEQASYYCPPTARDVAVFRDTTFYANRASLPALVLTVPGALTADINTGLFSNEDRQYGIGVRVLASATATHDSAVVGVSNPDDLLGVVAGQYVFISYSGTILQARIISVGPSSFTMDTPWPGISPAPAVIATYDAWKMHVYYADGTTADYDGLISTDQYEMSDLVMQCPGLRLLGAPSAIYPLPSYGASVTFIHTFPAIKRVLGFDLVLTNGQNYSPAYTGDFATSTDPLKSLNDTRPNRLFWSKTGQPEQVPLANYNDIGAGTILKMAPTQSALLVLCTDGLWRVTGDNPTFTVNQVDPTVTLLHPDCLNTLNNQIYGWVEDGLALIGEDGAQTISTDAVGPDIREWATQIKNWGAPYFWGPCIMGDRFWNEVWLNVYRAHSSADEFTSVTTLVYNTDTKNFTRLQTPFFSSLQYSPDANRMISQVFIPGSPANHIALTVQSDFYNPAGNSWLPVTVWFNALQTDDKGKLKQWMDVNYFVADVEIESGDNYSLLKALFDARNENNDPLAADYTVNVQSMILLSRDVHFWVPRRTALSDQQQLGVKSLIYNSDSEVFDDTHGFNFQLQGFTVRYRVASDTLKR